MLPQICNCDKEAAINGPLHPCSGVFFLAHHETNRPGTVLQRCSVELLNICTSHWHLMSMWLPFPSACAKQLQTAVPAGRLFSAGRQRLWKRRTRSMDLLPFSHERQAFFCLAFFIPLLLFHSFVNTSYQPFSSPLQMRSGRLWLTPGAFSQPFSTWDPLRPANAAAKPSLHSNYWKGTIKQRWWGRYGRHHVAVLAIRHSQRFVLWDLGCCDTRNIVAWTEIKKPFLVVARREAFDLGEESRRLRKHRPLKSRKEASEFSTDSGLGIFFSSFHFQTITSKTIRTAKTVWR